MGAAISSLPSLLKSAETADHPVMPPAGICVALTNAAGLTAGLAGDPLGRTRVECDFGFGVVVPCCGAAKWAAWAIDLCFAEAMENWLEALWPDANWTDTSPRKTKKE